MRGRNVVLTAGEAAEARESLDECVEFAIRKGWGDVDGAARLGRLAARLSGRAVEAEEQED